MKRIFVNGVEYGDPEEMPPRVRRIYEARLRGDEGGAGPRSGGARDAGPVRVSAVEETVVELDAPDPEVRGEGGPVERRVETRIVVDGKEYSDPDALPPRARELYEYMMSGAAGQVPVPGGGLGPGPVDRMEVVESRTVRHLHGPDGIGGSRRETAHEGSGSDWNPVPVVVAVLVILLVVSLLT